MSKNIVLCCDGTSNEYNYAQTNVVRLYATLVDDPARQITSTTQVLVRWGRRVRSPNSTARGLERPDLRWDAV